MNFKTSLNSIVLSALLAAALTACGGSSKAPIPKPPAPYPTKGIPTNSISHAYFRDQDSDTGKLSGTIQIQATAAVNESNAADFIWVYWADASGNKIDVDANSAWLKTDLSSEYNSSVYSITIPEDTLIEAQAFIIYPRNANGLALNGTLIKFHDFIGNTQLSGPGGNYKLPWYYGVPDSDIDVEGFDVTYTEQRATISVHRSQAGMCTFDNGLVSIIDMNYERDIAWEAGKGSGPDAQANEADDNLFPIYQYACAESPINTHRYVGDEEGAWLYSSINDAMFYGTIVYDTFVKYLGEPPINDKLRIRLHYGSTGSTTGYWDGTYATFGDGIPLQLSASSLDSIGHEVGHGVLNRIMGIDFFQTDLSKSFRTLHEAFSDISGVMAWYEYVEQTGEYKGKTSYWRHGEENQGQKRHLDQIVTEYEAIETMLDYDESEGNYYLSLGMFTYPFYLLQQQWGMEEAYGLYIAAARNCWAPTMNHSQIAQCLKQQAALISPKKADDVVAAFKAVKIKLFDEGVLSHYSFEKSKLRTHFTDDSRSTSQVTEWLWDFGDDTTSTLQSPQHTYAASGDYRVKLTVVDAQNYKDDFTRYVSVTDQYCYITTGLEPDNDIGTVFINGTNIHFDPTKSDYRELDPIQLVGVNRTLNLDVTGASNIALDETTKWTVWLDINDDGFYTADEKVSEQTIAINQPYGINISKDLSAFIAAANMAEGEPTSEVGRFIRVVGENSYSDACSSAAGEAFDVRVAW